MGAKLGDRGERAVPEVAAAMLLGVVAAVLASNASRAGEAAASPHRHPDNPPPIEDILKPPPPPSRTMEVELGPFPGQAATKFSCDANTAGCVRLLADVSVYNQLRRCWDFPDKPKLSAEFSFGVSAVSAGAAGLSIGPGKGARAQIPVRSAISIGLQLNPDGSLAASPQAALIGPAPDLRPVADDIVRAIRRCQPYKIPSGLSYSIWKDVTIGMSLVDETRANAPRHGP